MKTDESAIISACQAGDLEKFGALYDEYIRKIYKFVYYRTHHRETAEDLVSKTFVKALENLGSFDISRGTFSAWLYRIARNTVIDHYRTRKTEINIKDVFWLAGEEDAERDLDARMKLSGVEKYLKSLKSEQREIIIMRVWQEMSYREIAEVLGKSEAGCKMVFSRAMAKLRKEVPLAALLQFLFIL